MAKIARDKKKGSSSSTEKLNFPPRMYTKDDEPEPHKSFQIFSSTPTLLDEVKKALTVGDDNPWDEIKQSTLGVFVEFFEKKIKWASRVAHYILSFQLVCNKKNEIWSLIGSTPIRFSLNEFEVITGLNCDYVENVMWPEVEVTEEMKDYWVRLGINEEVGPSYDDLVAACSRCSDWERDDKLRLGYLAILANYIDARTHGQPIDLNLARLVMDLERFVEYPWGRVAFKKVIASVKEADITRSYHINGFAQVLQSWAFYALPVLGDTYGCPYDPPPHTPLLAYKGSKGKRGLKPSFVKQVTSFLKLFDWVW